METKFNFNSQVCTDVNQSRRLLKLGLKKETADMVYEPHYVNGVLKDYFKPKILDKRVLEYMLTDEGFYEYIPAWSLHRLIEILDTNPCVFYTNCGYDNIIDRIEDYIKERFIDTRYLEEWCLNEEE